MKRMILILSAAAVLAFTASLQAGYVENFTNDTSGWKVTTINNGGNVKYRQPVYNSTPGDSGGYISYPAHNPGNRTFGFTAPEAELFGELNGKTLSVDYKIDGNVLWPVNATARFYVGRQGRGHNYYVSDDLHSFSLNATNGWKTSSVKMDETNFVSFSSHNGNNETFEDLLDDADDIGLVFTGSLEHSWMLGAAGTKNTEIAIDNFGIASDASVPEPSTVLLLGLSSAFLWKSKLK